MSKKSNNENAYAILEAGETYQFAGYRWVPVEINENCHVAVMQSLGVTAGPWPGFSMENLGDGKPMLIISMSMILAGTMIRLMH